MGNRAVIEFTDTPIAIYLHWNGGRNSVEAFLQVARDLRVRTNDPAYRMARLTQIIGNYFGGTTSVGIGLAEELDRANGDNGVYVVNPEFEIVERHHMPYKEQSEPHMDDMYSEIMSTNYGVFYPKENKDEPTTL